jgi:hypothetical protein
MDARAAVLIAVAVVARGQGFDQAAGRAGVWIIVDAKHVAVVAANAEGIPKAGRVAVQFFTLETAAKYRAGAAVIFDDDAIAPDQLVGSAMVLAET